MNQQPEHSAPDWVSNVDKILENEKKTDASITKSWENKYLHKLFVLLLFKVQNITTAQKILSEFDALVSAHLVKRGSPTSDIYSFPLPFDPRFTLHHTYAQPVLRTSKPDFCLTLTGRFPTSELMICGTVVIAREIDNSHCGKAFIYNQLINECQPLRLQTLCIVTNISSYQVFCTNYKPTSSHQLSQTKYLQSSQYDNSSDREFSRLFRILQEYMYKSFELPVFTLKSGESIEPQALLGTGSTSAVWRSQMNIKNITTSVAIKHFGGLHDSSSIQSPSVEHSIVVSAFQNECEWINLMMTHPILSKTMSLIEIVEAKDIQTRNGAKSVGAIIFTPIGQSLEKQGKIKMMTLCCN